MSAREDGWHLRATPVGGPAVVGHVRDLSSVEVAIDGARIRLRDLTLLERGRADSGPARHGALLGGAIGLASGLLLFTPFAEMFGHEVDEVRLVATSTIVGAAFGATIGGVLSIGRMIWEPVWSR